MPTTITHAISAQTGSVVALEVAEQRDAVVDAAGGEAPPGRDHREEERGEAEAPGEQRDGVAVADAALGEQDVGRCR